MKFPRAFVRVYLNKKCVGLPNSLSPKKLTIFTTIIQTIPKLIIWCDEKSEPINPSVANNMLPNKAVLGALAISKEVIIPNKYENKPTIAPGFAPKLEPDNSEIKRQKSIPSTFAINLLCCIVIVLNKIINM